MQERRRTPRRRSYLGGALAFNKGASVLDCLVRDLTETGARVECPPTAFLPCEIDLTISCKGLQGRAHMVWRRGTQVGLAFTTGLARVGGPDNVVPIGTAHLIAKLQAANADLRRRVTQLSEGG